MVVGLLQDARAIRNQFQGHLGDVMTDAQRVGAVDVFRRIALLCGAEEDAACIVRGTGLRDMGLADVRCVWGVVAHVYFVAAVAVATLPFPYPYHNLFSSTTVGCPGGLGLSRNLHSNGCHSQLHISP
jgi:hypothetical protein